MPVIGFEQMKHAAFYGVTFTTAELRNRSVDLTPDAAVARDLCPETGQPLEELNIADHIARLWPTLRSAEAVRRIDMLQKWETAHATPPEEKPPAAAAAASKDATAKPKTAAPEVK